MFSDKLTKDMIQQPQLWRLAMEVSDERLQVVMYSIHEDNSLIFRNIPLDASAQSPLAALEDAIYENPLLLSDFSKVDCLIDTSRFTVVPSEIRSDDLRRRLLASLWPDDGYEVVADDIPGCRATILTAVDSGVGGFIGRTFIDADVSNRIAPLATYFAGKSRLGNSGKMFVNLHGRAMDIISFGRDTLRMANTIVFESAEDAVYYILASAKVTEFSVGSDELMICGDGAMREQLMPMLRRYISYVMPVVFPSAMMRAGKDAMSVPFELIVLESIR